MHSAGRASWQNPRVLTTLIMVFVAGALTGALAMRIGLHERIHPAGTVWKDPDAAKAFLDRCRKDLGLSPQQTEQMAAILDDYKAYYENVQEQLADVRSTGKTRILDLLNPDQRRKFEKILSEMAPPK
jgi:uncharacterized membrane-anchored protein YhcB (DUF1043 family)